jgi:hypothetical protein
VKNVNEDMLQDYLDGRLGEKERAELEALLENDPELAERLESYREIGRALREDEPQLSPGFYTKARARFEESKKGKMRMPRLLSWEAAGLATAAALVCVLFIPYLLDRDRQGDELPPAEKIWEAPAVEGEVEDAEAAPAPKEEKIELEMEIAPAPTTEPKAPPALPAAEEVDDSMMLEGEKMEKRAASPPMPSVQADAVQAEPRREKREKKGARSVALGQMDEGLAAAPAPFEIVALSPGVVESNIVMVEELDPGRRRVLIGARELPFGCVGISVAVTADSYRITLTPVDDPSLADSFGCAVIVANDHRTIEVLPPLDEHR